METAQHSLGLIPNTKINTFWGVRLKFVQIKCHVLLKVCILEIQD